MRALFKELFPNVLPQTLTSTLQYSRTQIHSAQHCVWKMSSTAINSVGSSTENGLVIQWHFSTLNRNLCFSWKYTPWPDNNLSRNVTKCWVSATHNNCYWPLQYHWSLISGYHSFWIYWRQNNNRHFSMRKNNHRYKDSKISANSWREITKTIGMDLREGIKKWNNYRDKSHIISFVSISWQYI